MYEDEHERTLYEQAFAEAITFATEGLRAERVMVIYSGNGRLHNLDPAQLWTSEPVSLTLLRSLIEGGRPRMIMDTMKSSFYNVTSVMLTGIYSVLFVPIRARTQEICGACYLDTLARNGPFQEQDLKQVEAVVAGRLEPLLRQAGACRPLTWDVMVKTCWL